MSKRHILQCNINKRSHEYNDIIIFKVHVLVYVYTNNSTEKNDMWRISYIYIYISYIFKQTAKQNTVDTCTSPPIIPIIAILHEVCIFAEAYDH